MNDDITKSVASGMTVIAIIKNTAAERIASTRPPRDFKARLDSNKVKPGSKHLQKPVSAVIPKR
jgi:hypothetical protein